MDITPGGAHLLCCLVDWVQNYCLAEGELALPMRRCAVCAFCTVRVLRCFHHDSKVSDVHTFSLWDHMAVAEVQATNPLRDISSWAAADRSETGGQCSSYFVNMRWNKFPKSRWDTCFSDCCSNLVGWDGIFGSFASHKSTSSSSWNTQ